MRGRLGQDTFELKKKKKSEILMNSFIRSQFNYCPLVWMFHDRATNSKLNRIHERALRLVCKDSESELEKLKKNMEIFMGTICDC